MSDQDSHLPDQINIRVAVRVREEIARRRISRQLLADEARISLSTLEKALSGHRPFTLATIIRLEQAMGVALREQGNEAPGHPTNNGNSHAAEELGAYSRASVSWLEGNYLTLRPSFGEDKAIFAYTTEIGWDFDAGHLSFRERERSDVSFSQHGAVSVPHLSGHIYLVTNTSGQYRMAVLSRPSITGEMFGILTTLRAGQGAHLTPVATPLALVPMKQFADPSFGRVRHGDRSFADYSMVLSKTLDDGYAGFVAG
ncbi:helix-turn-helix transcriptional regulator [Ochrobactrum vermis]|uniref:Helix-turn-helix transcriptional regulator n=1 Tax=Ochrobactrum vermis TaxID=1827297 RepID=A0ABU8PAX7_9HYPH|nr:helix-turn-helix transcriptional regulator [Ochrobactrum vermis]PQZ29883.1 transcriptional regulator [Ochrobactrum vermis]